MGNSEAQLEAQEGLGMPGSFLEEGPSGKPPPCRQLPGLRTMQEQMVERPL